MNLGFHIDRYDGVFGGWYAVRDRDNTETGVHLFRLGAWVAGLRLVLRG